jgi:hypothetical protein
MICGQNSNDLVVSELAAVAAKPLRQCQDPLSASHGDAGSAVCELPIIVFGGGKQFWVLLENLLADFGTEEVNIILMFSGVGIDLVNNRLAHWVHGHRRFLASLGRSLSMYRMIIPPV